MMYEHASTAMFQFSANLSLVCASLRNPCEGKFDHHLAMLAITHAIVVCPCHVLHVHIRCSRAASAKQPNLLVRFPFSPPTKLELTDIITRCLFGVCSLRLMVFMGISKLGAYNRCCTRSWQLNELVRYHSTKVG